MSFVATPGHYGLSDFEGDEERLTTAATAAHLRQFARIAPSLMAGLNPSEPGKSLCPTIIRFEKAGLIEFGDVPAMGGFLSIAKRRPRGLVHGMLTALQEKLREDPEWKYNPKGGETPSEPVAEEDDWGGAPKEPTPDADLPPRDDPRFGTW